MRGSDLNPCVLLPHCKVRSFARTGDDPYLKLPLVLVVISFYI